MDVYQSKTFRRGRMLYHAEAALEYFIALLVSGSFLANLTSKLGISDALTGIISSFISLGCLFQLIALLIRPTRVKRLVVFGSILNQIFFLLLYVLPIGDYIPASVKTIIFVVTILAAYFIYNIVFPKKITWLMSLVSDEERGRFTAYKEIISLISGIVFTFAMGQLIDRCELAGKSDTAFVITAVTIAVIIVLHTLTMCFTIEPEDKAHPTPRLREGIKFMLANRGLRCVVIVFVLYNVANAFATPFYGSFQIKELALSQTTIQLLSAAGSLVRMFTSIPMGKLADKVGFAKMLRLCFGLLALSYLCVAFATPLTGLVCFLLYYVMVGIAMSGISSATVNLVFDYVPKENRADSLALSQAIAGVSGFLTTVCVSPLITAIQQNGNRVLGLPLYAQQFTSIIALLLVGVTTLFLYFAIIRKGANKQ